MEGESSVNLPFYKIILKNERTWKKKEHYQKKSLISGFHLNGHPQTQLTLQAGNRLKS